jgi:hypothetical protein
MSLTQLKANPKRLPDAASWFPRPLANVPPTPARWMGTDSGSPAPGAAGECGLRSFPALARRCRPMVQRQYRALNQGRSHGWLRADRHLYYTWGHGQLPWVEVADSNGHASCPGARLWGGVQTLPPPAVPTGVAVTPLRPPVRATLARRPKGSPGWGVLSRYATWRRLTTTYSSGNRHPANGSEDSTG